MSDRSEELRRQRDLLREHLAWVEKELAAEEGRAIPAPAPEAPQQIFAPEPADNRDAESILSEYRRPETAIATQTKLGCIIYFVVAVVLVAIGVFAFYLFSKASRAR